MLRERGALILAVKKVTSEVTVASVLLQGP